MTFTSTIARRFATALALAITLTPLLAGCIPTSKNPIGDTSTARLDPDLAGLWRVEPKKGEQSDEGPYYIAFAPREDGGVEVCFFGTRGGKKGLELSLYRGFTTRVGERRFLSVSAVLINGVATDVAKNKSNPPEYFLLGYEVADGKARMGLANMAPLMQAVQKGKLKGEAKTEPTSSVALTDTSEALGAYFSSGKLEDHFQMDIGLVRIEAGPAPATAPAPEAGK